MHLIGEKKVLKKRNIVHLSNQSAGLKTHLGGKTQFIADFGWPKLLIYQANYLWVQSRVGHFCFTTKKDEIKPFSKRRLFKGLFNYDLPLFCAASIDQLR